MKDSTKHRHPLTGDEILTSRDEMSRCRTQVHHNAPSISIYCCQSKFYMDTDLPQQQSYGVITTRLTITDQLETQDYR